MRLVFIDDSEQAKPRRHGLGPLLALGAVIVPEEQIAGYAEDLLKIKTDIGMPPTEEAKWKPAKNSFLATAGGEVVSTLRQRMFDAALARQIKTAVVMLDHSKAYTSRSRAEVGQELLKWLYERITMHLVDNNDIGIVIADKPGGGPKDDTRWLADTLHLTSDGTEHVSPDRIVIPIVTGASHHVPHLQLADLVVAATTAAVAGNPHGVALGPKLLQLAHKNTLGLAGGAGIVIWPPDLTNLLHWAFGEKTYAKVARNVGVTLPWRDWPYAEDDGLASASTA
jgi:hypothetical protein